MTEFKPPSNYLYLDLKTVAESLGDDALVSELLCLLHDRLPDDWAAFEKSLNENQISPAVGIIHSIKGTVPMFSDKQTTSLINLMEEGLRTQGLSGEVKELFLSLQLRMQRFILELGQWHATQEP
jgi:HPt (histidine-containing phosphotransfer) domain-containing protein